MEQRLSFPSAAATLLLTANHPQCYNLRECVRRPACSPPATNMHPCMLHRCSCPAGGSSRDRVTPPPHLCICFFIQTGEIRDVTEAEWERVTEPDRLTGVLQQEVLDLLTLAHTHTGDMIDRSLKGCGELFNTA